MASILRVPLSSHVYNFKAYNEDVYSRCSVRQFYSSHIALIINSASSPQSLITQDYNHHHHQQNLAGTIDYKKEEKHHKHKEQLGKLGAATAGAFALHEKHQAKKDPEHAHSHKIKQEIAATIAVGAGGYALHEHHKKKEAKKKYQETHGKKHHHLFH